MTEAVANCPTPPLSGCHSDTSAETVYEGFVVETVVAIGLITTEAAVPKSGKIVASTDEAAKSWKNSIEIELSASPATRVFAVEPKDVVSMMSYFVSKVTDEIEVERSVPAMETNGLVSTSFAIMQMPL